MNTNSSTFTFGVVEGFYGVFYTLPERIDLIRFLGGHGYNLYVYAPKNDRQHRARWWEPYPDRIMAEFATTIQAAQESGMRFCYAISPGGSICYSSAQDFEKLTVKLRGFYDLGVRDFSLMLDDNEPGFRHAADADCYLILAAAQADLANRLYRWLQALDPHCTLSFVPADYSGAAPFSSTLAALGQALHPAIDVCYTGREICAPEISAVDARTFGDVLRRPPLIWDNYPVNDLSMNPELHLGPIRGRAADLPRAIRGILVNPMIQAEASKIPLATYAAYIADPLGYREDTAWEVALAEVAGEDYVQQIKILAESTDYSFLGQRGEILDQLANQAMADLEKNLLDSPAIQDLEAYLTEIDESTYILKFRLENLSLRNNLLLWIEVLEHWMWLTRFSLKVLRAIRQGQDYFGDLNRVHEYREAIRNHPKRIATEALLPISEFAIAAAGQDQRERTNGTYQSNTLLESRYD